MQQSPLVSVVIPLIEINDFLILENLPAFTKQSYRNFEVIVLSNKTSATDKGLLKKYKWLKIVPTGKVTRPAQKRDIGVKHSKGEIIAFIDDDAFPTSNWLENAVNLFQSRKVDAVCGPGILPNTAGLWERIFDEVLKLPIGSGSYGYRFVKQPERYIDDYPSMNFLILKKTFTELGGFNSKYWPGEDSKLCNDLVHKKQGKILYHPGVTIYHHRRDNVKGYLKQHGSYGFHRGAFFAHGDANSKRFVYLVPTIFVTYILVLILISILMNMIKIGGGYIFIFSLPLIIYLIGAFYAFTTALINQKNLLVAFMTPIVLFSTHIVYGIIFIKGYFKGKNQSKHIYD